MEDQEVVLAVILPMVKKINLVRDAITTKHLNLFVGSLTMMTLNLSRCVALVEVVTKAKRR